jgi:hypothetical protein
MHGSRGFSFAELLLGPQPLQPSREPRRIGHVRRRLSGQNAADVHESRFWNGFPQLLGVPNHMRCEDYVGEATERTVLGQGFILEDIQTRPSNRR